MNQPGYINAMLENQSDQWEWLIFFLPTLSHHTTLLFATFRVLMPYWLLETTMKETGNFCQHELLLMLFWILQCFGKKESEGLQSFTLGVKEIWKKYLQRIGDGEDIVEKDGILVDRHKPEHPSEAEQRQQHNRHLHTAPAREIKRKNQYKSLSIVSRGVKSPVLTILWASIYLVKCPDGRTNRYHKQN